MSLFDETIDERTVAFGGAELPLPEAIAAAFAQMPDIATLRETARRLEAPSPAFLLSQARWEVMLDALRESGFDDEAILRVLMRATANAYADLQVHQPPDEQLEAALNAADHELVAMAVEDLANLEAPNAGQKRKAGLAVAVFSRRAEVPQAFDARVTFGLRHELMREFLLALPQDRRTAKLDELLDQPPNRLNAFWRAEAAVHFMDLLTESQVARLRACIDAIAEGEPDDDEERLATLSAAFDRGEFEEDDDWLERDEDGLTRYASNALEYWIDQIGAERMRDQLGPLAESRVDVAITVDAPELATLETWRAAPEARQVEIARAVEEAGREEFELTYLGLETYADDLRIAVFDNAHTGMKLSLVPGGTYLRGFSEREEQIVRAAGAADPDAGNWYETYEYIIEQADSMRPTAQVTVGPLLVFQLPSEPVEPAEATAMLEELPFRLMSEAEHEWVARGGHASELTWRGDEIPDEDWMEEVFEAGEKLRNPFGLGFLGMTPEALADVYEPTYEGAPSDGSARTGDGPRVTRGGAEMLYPWQACGEWQLLTNAVRTSTAEWEYFLAIRPAIGVRVS